MAMISYAFKEYPASQERDLQSLYVHIRIVRSPSVGSNAVRDEGRKETVKVGQKEDDSTGVSRVNSWLKSLQSAAYEQLYEQNPVVCASRGRLQPRIGPIACHVRLLISTVRAAGVMMRMRKSP
jgi:hypothetical protein